MHLVSEIKKALISVVSPYNQLIVLVITALITIFMSYKAHKEIRPLEPMPHLYAITPEKLVEWGGRTPVVKVGLHINNWPVFNLVANQFVVDGILWFEFDSALISLDTIDKFSFEKGELLKKSKPKTKIVENKLLAEYEIRLQFTSNISYELFPLDDHRIYIGMVNTALTPREMLFESFLAGFTFSPGIYNPGWRLVNYQVVYGYGESKLDEHDDRKFVIFPKVIFSFDFQQAGVSKILLILLPLFLFFILGLFSFAYDPAIDAGTIRTLASSSLASIITYRFVIQSMSPNVGYFILSDYIFLLFLSFAFIQFIMAIILTYLGKLTPFLALLRGIIFLLSHISFIICWYYLLFVWTRI